MKSQININKNFRVYSKLNTHTCNNNQQVENRLLWILSFVTPQCLRGLWNSSRWTGTSVISPRYCNSSSSIRMSSTRVLWSSQLQRSRMSWISCLRDSSCLARAWSICLIKNWPNKFKKILCDCFCLLCSIHKQYSLTDFVEHITDLHGSIYNIWPDFIQREYLLY